MTLPLVREPAAELLARYLSVAIVITLKSGSVITLSSALATGAVCDTASDAFCPELASGSATE